MKNRLLILLVLIATFGYAQTFDWETAYHGANTPNGPGWTNNRAIQEFTTPSYSGVVFTTPNATPINISNVGQGSTGLSVRNAAFETSVNATFVFPLNIQTIKVFAYPNSSNENWTFKAKDAGGNVTNTLTAAVTSTASVIPLNFTNVYVLEISKTDGTIGSFGVDDIVFTPYVAPIVTIPDANFKAYLVNNYSINTNYDSEIQVSEATAFTGTIDLSSLGVSDLTGVEAFTALTQLGCVTNQLTSLDLSANTALISIDCRDNQLTSLDLPASTALTELKFGDNQITSLDVSANTALTELSGHSNQLTSLDVSSNTALIDLDFDGSPITSIDVSANTALVSLAISRTQLTSIDVSTNTALEYFYATDCQLTRLDLSAQPNLELLWCNKNQLTSLNIANGNNANMTSFYATENTALTCIEVDAAIVGTSPTEWYKDAGATYSASCTTCTVNIPDANFKAYLVGNTAINTNGDTEIQCSEATAFTGAIDVYYLGITDLTGVEAFTALTELQCGSNQLTSLDVSGNTALTNLRCENNQLTSLNLPVTTNALTDLRCNNNQLTSLDVSANTALTILACNYNPLTGIDVSTNIALEYLHLWDNPLTGIDVSNNTALLSLEFGYTPMTSIDVSANTNLESLSFGYTQLTSIDVSTNTALKWVYCENNQLMSLDLSAQPNLEELTCYNNQLTSLNVANGNNANMYYFNATNNTGLTCINVDAAIVGTSPTDWFKDAGATYNVNCGLLSVDDFSLNTVSIYPNPATSVLHIEMDQDLKQATIYSLLGKQVLRTQNNTIDVSSLPNGIFLIKVENEKGSIITKRFMKK